jgi:adenylyltransferase/sulfurtransferase
MHPGRYVRQCALPQIGAKGQKRLSEKNALIVGCGALGGAQAEWLTRAGIGKLVIVDRDIPEIDNLPRQILFDERDVRERIPKAIAAAKRLRNVNSEIVIEGIVADVTADTVSDLIGQADILLDGTDNFETRFLLNDAAIRSGIPWIYGGVLGTQGMVMAIRPGTGPCLRCIFPEPPQPGTMPTCDTHGVLNTAVAWVAALQVTEAIRILLDSADAVSRIHTMDIWTPSLVSSKTKQNPHCICCVQRCFEFLDAARGVASRAICGRNAVQITPEKPYAPNFPALEERLSAFGHVVRNGFVLELSVEDRKIVIFPDGRILVMGTTDVAEARSFIARTIGC